LKPASKPLGVLIRGKGKDGKEAILRPGAKDGDGDKHQIGHATCKNASNATVINEQALEDKTPRREIPPIAAAAGGDISSPECPVEDEIRMPWVELRATKDGCGVAGKKGGGQKKSTSSENLKKKNLDFGGKVAPGEPPERVKGGRPFSVGGACESRHCLLQKKLSGKG